MEQSRIPTQEELSLIDVLVKRADLILPSDWHTKLKVCPMEDGGMGSLIIYPNGEISMNRLYGAQLSELTFQDLDGIEVIATLNSDDKGELFELDIWKTNFDKLLSYPKFHQYD